MTVRFRLLIVAALTCATPWSSRAPADEPPYKRLLAGDGKKKAEELTRMIGQLEEADQYAEAIQAAQELLALRRRVQGTDHHETLNLTWQLESLRRVASLPAEQRTSWRSAVRNEQKAWQLEQQANYAQAFPLKQKLLDIRRQVLGSAHPDTAMSYNHVALNLNARAKYVEAEPLLRQALAIRQQALGPAHPDTAQSYNNVAYNLDYQGKHAEAEPLFRQALAIRRQALGPAHPDTATIYNNVGYNLNAQGRHAEAEPLFRQALVIYQQALGEVHPDTARVHNNIAYNLDAQGRHAEAEPLHRQALAIKQQALGATHPAMAPNFNNLGYNLNAQGKHSAAEPLFQKALAIQQHALGEVHPLTALSYNSVAMNLNAQGKHADAEQFLQKALTIRRQVLGEAHPDTVTCSTNVAVNLCSQGKHTEALAEATTAARSYEAARLAVARTGLERAAFGARRSPLPLLAACLARAGQHAEACQRLEQHLARGLLDDFAARATPTRRPEDLQQLGELRSRLSTVERQITAHLGRKDPLEAGRDRFTELSKQRQGVQDELAALDAKWAQEEVLPLDRIQAQIPADAALVAWVDLKALVGAADPKGDHWACIVKKAGEPVWVRLPGSGEKGAWTKDDDSLPQRLRQTLASGVASAPRETAGADATGLAQKLHTQRLAPFGKHLDGVKRLIVLPAGWMAGVPVEALTERYTVSYAPSGSIAAKLHETRPTRSAPPRLLALADPAFTRPEIVVADEPAALKESRVRGSKNYVPLPGSRREVNAIAALFADKSVLLGADASEQRLEQLAKSQGLKDFSVLHFATHGEVDRATAARCALLLAQDKLPDPLEQAQKGLKVYDGKLDVAEILADWQLDAELVTLSACESGLGQEGGGEGLMGFSQVLLLKGARSLVVSLWPVSDTATALLMVRFYENWLGKRPGLDKPMPKAEALKEAKHWLRNLTRKEVEQRIANLPEAARGLKLEGTSAGTSPAARDDKPFAHPFYWSAFILIGDPE